MCIASDLHKEPRSSGAQCALPPHAPYMSLLRSVITRGGGGYKHFASGARTLDTVNTTFVQSLLPIHSSDSFLVESVELTNFDQAPDGNERIFFRL